MNPRCQELDLKKKKANKQQELFFAIVSLTGFCRLSTQNVFKQDTVIFSLFYTTTISKEKTRKQGLVKKQQQEKKSTNTKDILPMSKP